MVFPKTLAQRFLTVAKIRSAAPPPASRFLSPLLRRMLPGSGEEPGLLRRLLQRRPLFQQAIQPDRLNLPSGEKLIERLRGMSGDRICLDALVPPPPLVAAEKAAAEGRRISVEEVRKVLRATQMEAARSRLRAVPRSCVSYSEFVRICCEVSNAEQGVRIARSLDESGAVIVLGDSVFLHPDQVAKAIEGVIPLPMAPQNDGRRSEVQEMEEKKAAIDQKAEARVRRELWCGLGLMVLQTAGFMRLTFWELSWDVMEPICFYVTSIYFMAGYAFFLRTSKDPSFEGFFQSRFAAKQKRLMKACNFDIKRFNELKGGCPAPPWTSGELASSPPYCHCNRRGAILGAAAH